MTVDEYEPFRAYKELYVPPGLKFKHFTWWLHSAYVFSEQTVTFTIYDINSLVFITEVESVYSAVRTDSLYEKDTFSF